MRNKGFTLLSPSHGFTLPELLISLAILGVIATFTIPKIVAAQQNNQYNAQAKEAASMISAAYETYKQRGNTPNSNTSGGDLTPYMNYVAADASSSIDLFYTGTTRACSGGYSCIRLHNGGMLLWASAGFMGTASTNAVYFYYDPDGVVTDGTTNGPGKSVCLWLYYSGRVSSYSNLSAGTVYGGGTVGPMALADPPWFQW